MDRRQTKSPGSTPLTEIEGQLEHVTYHNEETGYTVARLKTYGQREPVTIVGQIMAPTPGEILTLKGEWSNHNQYGTQFKVKYYQTKIPASVQGIRKYLGSGLIKGIGPVMAKKIVDHFGVDTLEIIEHEIEKLLEVDSIGRKRVEMIRRAWSEQKEIRRLMIFLQEHQVPSGHAARIFKHYGEKAVEILKENPYRLAYDIRGIGFITADRIAEKLGFAKESVLRGEAGLLYVLHELAGKGHVYYPREGLLEKASEILDIPSEIIGRLLESLAGEGLLVIEERPEGDIKGRVQTAAVYLAGYHRAETGIVTRLETLIASEKLIRRIDADKAVIWVQRELGLDLAAGQVEAVRRAANDKVLVITGGPGTGKTTIIRSVLAIFDKLKAQIMLAAPTGRAAKRMSEATGHEAKTIHRLLDYKWQQGGFQINDKNPLEADLLILDEASMIDTVLMNHLLKAVPAQATLILVGDVDQLPSVGPGNVLDDIISSGRVPVVRLTEIFRQARESSIIVNAHLINRGIKPKISVQGGKLDDFYFIERDKPEDALKTIIEVVAERVPKRFGLDPFTDIQVLSPMHRGVVGAGNLNLELQNVLNPGGMGVTRGGREFRLGDKIMQVTNNYDKEVFNGDIGKMTGLDLERREVYLTFDGRKVIYDFNELDEVVQAYAISIHKSQGSEFEAVVAPVLTQHYMMLQRNLLYTAVTRGKKLVVLVGSEKALGLAVRNDGTKRRYSGLARRLTTSL